MPPRNAQGKPGQRAGDVARFWYVQHRLKDLQEYYQLCGRIVTNSAVWGYSCRCDKTSDGLTFPQTCGIALATKQYQKASLARDFGFDLDRIDARIMGRHRETWVNHLEHDIAAGYVNMKNSPPPATKRKRTPDAPSPDLATLLNRPPPTRTATRSQPGPGTAPRPRLRAPQRVPHRSPRRYLRSTGRHQPSPSFVSL